MPRPWTVLPHRPIEKLQENLWTVEADLPRGPVISVDPSGAVRRAAEAL